MTEQPGTPEHAGLPPTSPPSAGPPPYPYSYPPGPYPPGPYPPGPAGSYPGNYPGGYPGGYPPPMPYGDYYPAGPVAAPRNGAGVAALVLAVIALVSSCSVIGGLLLGVLAVILGFIGRGRASRGEASNGVIATTGVILGFLAIALSIAFIAFWTNSFNRYGGPQLISCVQNAGSDDAKVQQCMDEFQQRVESETGQTRTPGR